MDKALTVNDFPNGPENTYRVLEATAKEGFLDLSLSLQPEFQGVGFSEGPPFDAIIRTEGEIDPDELSRLRNQTLRVFEMSKDKKPILTHFVAFEETRRTRFALPLLGAQGSLVTAYPKPDDFPKSNERVYKVSGVELEREQIKLRLNAVSNNLKTGCPEISTIEETANINTSKPIAPDLAERLRGQDIYVYHMTDGETPTIEWFVCIEEGPLGRFALTLPEVKGSLHGIYQTRLRDLSKEGLQWMLRVPPQQMFELKGGAAIIGEAWFHQVTEAETALGKSNNGRQPIDYTCGMC